MASVRIYLCRHYKKHGDDYIEYIRIERIRGTGSIIYVAHEKSSMRNIYGEWSRENLVDYVSHILSNPTCFNEAIPCSLDRNKLLKAIYEV